MGRPISPSTVSFPAAKECSLGPQFGILGLEDQAHSTRSQASQHAVTTEPPQFVRHLRRSQEIQGFRRLAGGYAASTGAHGRGGVRRRASPQTSPCRQPVDQVHDHRIADRYSGRRGLETPHDRIVGQARFDHVGTPRALIEVRRQSLQLSLHIRAGDKELQFVWIRTVDDR